ncbi:hypothetical protein JCM1840_002675 [Sporobolomyces johnsonii]
MRDLALRSSPAFHAFHLLKIFCEDSLSFQILRHTALELYAISSFVGPSSPIVAPPPSPGLQPQHSQQPPTDAAPPPLRLHHDPSTFSSPSSPSYRPPRHFSPSTRQLLETDYHHYAFQPLSPQTGPFPSPSSCWAQPDFAGPGEGEACDRDLREGPFGDVQDGLGPTTREEEVEVDRLGARGFLASWFGGAADGGEVSW